MIGTMSEMEVATFRQRAQTALVEKAKRGELFRRAAIGYVRNLSNRIEKDPDQRVRAAIDLVFRKFAELASVRGLYFWLCQQQIKLPSISRPDEYADNRLAIATLPCTVEMRHNS
jgi:DNA invertase Pin-like site-specific DNA recombinase